jgi:hypothetical protein
MDLVAVLHAVHLPELQLQRQTGRQTGPAAQVTEVLSA